MYKFLLIVSTLFLPTSSFTQTVTDTTQTKATDTMPTVFLHEVDILKFKTPQEESDYYRTRRRIQKVLPYVRIAKQLYAELELKKDESRRRDYRHYRKDVEKEMRAKFETELKNLTIGEGMVMVKLINRETGNNCFTILKEIKGRFNAWIYQQVGKHYGYDLKEDYNPTKEQLIEMAIRNLGAEYNVGS